MYISDLHLQGFKSFADKTHVKFDSGITAIVGPNGCGKSNIVDSLRWVLGEQRPSLLRSASMSNVIFNGTAKKKALGMSEVSLTFVNDKGLLPVEFSEVTITRRLYRSGDSEYLINNTPCRLRDIMDLFMDTGMGSDAYSVIELKMVEEILNDKNNDRRHLFEEAAGVTRYKEQRKKTLRKLAETKKDLQRVEDILIEIRKKARSLEIQAEKAEKAKKYKVELEEKDKGVTLLEFNKIKAELEPLQAQIEKAEKEKEEITLKAAKLESEDEAARMELLKKERAQAEAQRLVSQIASTIRDAETESQITSEKIENEKKVISQYQNDIKHSEKDLKDLQELLDDSVKKLETFDGDRKKSDQILNESKKKYTEFQQTYSKERGELYEQEVQLSSISNEIVKLQESKIKIESRLENTEGNLERIDQEIADLNKLVTGLSEEQAAVEKQLSALFNEREKLEENLEEQRDKREQFANAQNEVKDQIRGLRSKVEAYKSEIQLLNELASSNEAYPNSVKYLIDKQRFDFKLLAPVSELFDTDEEHAVALEAVLGSALNYIVVQSLADARKAASILKEQKKGRATFIPLDQLAATYPVDENALFHKVKCNSEFFALKQLLLGNVVLVETADDFTTLKAKNVSGVTKDGEVYTQSHFFKAGSKSKNAGIRVGLNDKIEKLEKSSKEAESEINQLENYLNQLVDKYSKLNIGELSQNLKEKEQDVRKIEQQLHSMNSKVQVYQKNISELVNRKDTLKGSEGSAQDELEAIQPKHEQLQTSYEKSESLVSEKKIKLQELEEQRSLAQSRYNDAQLKHQDMKNKLDNLERDITRAENGIEGLNRGIENRQRLITESNQRIKDYSESIKTLSGQLEEAKTQKTEADKGLAKAEEASAIQRGSINELEKNLKEIRRQREVNMDLVHHLSMAKEKFELQSQSLSDHIWDTYGILMNQVTETLPADTNIEETKSRISWLRQKLNSIGEVNMLAVDEFAEEKERLELYETQIEDLESAEKQLLETIDEINETAIERFNTTFEEVRINFQKVFKTLFNEDDYCDLIIDENEEDPLESKIEIKAQPKGKRPSTINQLSGGEKTLTAIALLFAIYLVKPSPFCVLDEVDAPLDDANIERFAKMIRNFSKETQFIIITHNKKTMEKAEMMYGVTMPETGVSKLVGVKMDEVA